MNIRQKILKHESSYGFVSPLNESIERIVFWHVARRLRRKYCRSERQIVGIFSFLFIELSFLAALSFEIFLWKLPPRSQGKQ